MERVFQNRIYLRMHEGYYKSLATQSINADISKVHLLFCVFNFGKGWKKSVLILIFRFDSFF